MKKFGFINNRNDVKAIQENLYKGDSYFIGITSDRKAWIYKDKVERIQSEDVAKILNISLTEAEYIIRNKGILSDKDMNEALKPNIEKMTLKPEDSVYSSESIKNKYITREEFEEFKEKMIDILDTLLESL